VICDICERPSTNGTMCRQCSAAWMAARRKDDGTIYAIMVWAAKRARFFAKQRVRTELKQRARR